MPLRLISQLTYNAEADHRIHEIQQFPMVVRVLRRIVYSRKKLLRRAAQNIQLLVRVYSLTTAQTRT
jgi:hypothetical protein